VILFVSIAVILISMHGGGFATMPAYLRDLFGTCHVSAIHGRSRCVLPDRFVTLKPLSMDLAMALRKLAYTGSSALDGNPCISRPRSPSYFLLVLNSSM